MTVSKKRSRVRPEKPVGGKKAPGKRARRKDSRAKRVKVVLPKGPASPVTVTPPVMPASAPIDNPNMCYGCKSKCCTLRVDLTPFDIARIVHSEGKEAKDFAVFVPAKPNDAFGFRLKGGYFKFVLLRKDGICCFSGDGALKCTIEKSKPAVCIVYPFSISYGITYLRRETVCPAENLQRADYSKMSAAVLRDYLWESARYEETLRLWNRHARGDEELAQFYSFVAHDIDADKSRLGGLKRSLGRMMLRIGLR